MNTGNDAANSAPVVDRPMQDWEIAVHDSNSQHDPPMFTMLSTRPGDEQKWKELDGRRQNVTFFAEMDLKRGLNLSAVKTQLENRYAAGIAPHYPVTILVHGEPIAVQVCSGNKMDELTFMKDGVVSARSTISASKLLQTCRLAESVFVGTPVTTFVDAKNATGKQVEINRIVKYDRVGSNPVEYVVVEEIAYDGKTTDYEFIRGTAVTATSARPGDLVTLRIQSDIFEE